MFGGFGDIFGNPYGGSRRPATRGHNFDDVYAPRTTRNPYGRESETPYGFGGYPEEIFDPYSRSRAQQQQAALERERRLKAQLEAEQEQRILAERRRKALLLEKQKKEHERKVLLFRYTRAAKKIQSWYRKIRGARLLAQQEKAAIVLTRTLKNAGPILNGKRVADSLRKLAVIENEISAILREANTKILENYTNSKEEIKHRLLVEDKLEKAILKMDVVPTYGCDFVRQRRKSIVDKAQKGLKALDDLDSKFGSPFSTPNPTPMMSASEEIPTLTEPEIQKMQLEESTEIETEEPQSIQSMVDTEAQPMSNNEAQPMSNNDYSLLQQELSSLQQQIYSQLSAYSNKLEKATAATTSDRDQLGALQKQVSEYLSVFSKPIPSVSSPHIVPESLEPKSPVSSKKKIKKNKHKHHHN